MKWPFVSSIIWRMPLLQNFCGHQNPHPLGIFSKLIAILISKKRSKVLSSTFQKILCMHFPSMDALDNQNTEIHSNYNINWGRYTHYVRNSFHNNSIILLFFRQQWNQLVTTLTFSKTGSSYQCYTSIWIQHTFFPQMLKLFLS